MTTSIEDLRAQAMNIMEDPNAVENMTDAEIMETRKHLNPLGNVITGKKVYANLSLVNFKDIYLRRLHMTSLIGYTYRMAEEYEPEDELNVEIESYKQRLETLNNRYEKSFEEKEKLRAELKETHELRMKLIKSTSKAIITKFLNRNFKFNPDKHLRSAHTSNKADPERKDKYEAIKQQVMLAEQPIDTKLSSKQDATYEYLRGKLLETYQAAAETTATLKATLKTILNPSIDVADKHGILMRKYDQLAKVTADLKKLAEPLAAADTLAAWKVDPPADVFHQFDRYLCNHYEQLRDVVTAVYNEKSDFEYAVIFYDSFKTPEAAREYRVKHDGEFRSDVFTVENSSVSLIGPFKENRERVDFYNKNTEILKRMMEQKEQDEKLGKDMMDKNIKAKKKKNIEEAGPDHPGLAAYSKQMNTVQELGARKVLTKEETDKLVSAREEAQKLKEDYEIPEDAIQVDVFFPEQTADGETTLKKSKFYTQSEAPLHMQEGSPFADKYQPKRAEGKTVDSGYKTQVIVSKTGEKRTIQVPKGDKSSVAKDC